MDCGGALRGECKNAPNTLKFEGEWSSMCGREFACKSTVSMSGGWVCTVENGYYCDCHLVTKIGYWERFALLR